VLEAVDAANANGIILVTLGTIGSINWKSGYTR